MPRKYPKLYGRANSDCRDLDELFESLLITAIHDSDCEDDHNLAESDC